MPIRIESLPLEHPDSTVGSQDENLFPSFRDRIQDIDTDISSEITHIYGGTTASIASASQPAPDPQDHVSPDRPQLAASPIGNWSNSLQTMLDRPPATLPNRMVMGGVMFCAVFAAWATVSQMDEVGRAPGRLVPQGDPYKVHPTVSGKIANLLVREGQGVKAGQVIAELESEIALKQVESFKQEQISYGKELLQTEDLIEKTRLESQTRVAITNAEIHAQEAAIAQVQAKLQSQDTTITQAQERASTSQKLLSDLQSDAAEQEERIIRLKSLVDEGALPREHLYQAQRNFGDRRRSITQQRGEIQLANAEARRMQADLQQVVAEARRMRAELAQKHAQGQNAQLQAQQAIQQLLMRRTQLLAKIKQTEKQQEAAKAALNQLTLKAPVDGVVLSLNIQNKGEVVQPGQTIAELASPKAPLMLTAALPTRESGFVKVGDTAQIKFDAYPYQDYGIVSGKVTAISPDAKVDERLGAFYRVNIAIDQGSIAAKSQAVQLKAGQTATAEIIVRRRHIIDMLLDPIRRLKETNLNL